MKINFEAFTKDIVQNNWKVHGVEVYENGVLTHDFGDTKDNLHELYSMTKTILSIAVGMAVDEGRFDIERSLASYMPKKRIMMLSGGQQKVWEKITIKRLLTMSVEGFPFRPQGDSWLDFSLACKIPDPEKITFDYSNISAYLVGVALTEALGEDLGKYIEEKLFMPLGITRYEYTRCPDGYFYGASGMLMTVHDISKIGLMMAQNGVYQGQRILSKEYIKEATGIQQMNREGGYGYFIWKYRDGFSINGKWKQKCYVLPEQEIVVTYLSHIEDDSHDLLESMEKNILGI